MNIPCTFPPELEPEEIPIAIVERQERDREMLDWFTNAIHILDSYQAGQRTRKQLRMSLRTWALALGMFTVADANGPAELARKCGVSKACLDKALNHFTKQLRLDPLPGQRCAAARNHMAAARKRQLSK
jgi:hypothetical protein